MSNNESNLHPLQLHVISRAKLKLKSMDMDMDMDHLVLDSLPPITDLKRQTASALSSIVEDIVDDTIYWREKNVRMANQSV